MSDALAALLIVVSVPLMKMHSRWSVYLLGFLAGYGVVIREEGSVVVVVACLLVVMTGFGAAVSNRWQCLFADSRPPPPTTR